ncbi:hypothetical protein XENOCAPTIV_029276 [Xenoophorus captivus]|uniref:Uncharacterized protein n=1 Tax=Xenoophorus captivus TaxID=1517983 RepID=A0ABV0RB33_9TELE
MSGSGIIVRSWPGTERTETRTTRVTEGTLSASSATSVTSITMSFLSTCAGTITSVISAMQMAHRSTTEQFTHAFRSEIDYKAHKAAAHSKNRAEARQNRHIDLQFNYAPRQQRRNEGGSLYGTEKLEVLPTNRPSRDSLVFAEMPHLCSCPSSVKPGPTAPIAPLKEEEFPSLSSAAVTSPMTPAYSGQPKKTSSFQEEDFPALVPKVRLLKPAASSNSAWSNSTAVAKPNLQLPPPSRAPPLLSAAPSGPQLLSSSNSSCIHKKKKVGEKGKVALSHSPSLSDDDSVGMTQQEFRSVPTMLDISSLLTVKGVDSKPSVTSSSSNPTPNTDVPSSKASKKKKQKNAAASSAPTVSGMAGSVNAVAVETAAQKENVPEKTSSKPLSITVTATSTSLSASGSADTTSAVCRDSPGVTPPPGIDPAPEPEEEFPALMTKKPPPGKT